MKTVAIIALVIVSASASTVIFKNNCKDAFDVVRTENLKLPVVQCHLNPRGECRGQFANNRSMNFKRGWGGKQTLAEFTFDNPKKRDFFDLSVVAGFDVPMSLSGNHYKLKCRHPKCPDAYLFDRDDKKNHDGPTGATYHVTFC
ncbi:unnamed protein product [Bursaphelenchus okinawaensis]|uniref:Uncharacterized protein n=1 Tax=Bursaphelenchus okinawaensis TaxID=465554 RepID=A0A811KSU2_9BILA|nr:unnamed protein product [Bursaphelenchus okinawaensis]CAG9112028.1 unnamed protein product [Bursaphelenchus okinawaensis]